MPKNAHHRHNVVGLGFVDTDFDGHDGRRQFSDRPWRDGERQPSLVDLFGRQPARRAFA